MIAVDDGIASGNLNAADIFWLIGAIVALLGAIAYAATSLKAARWAPVLLSLAVGCVAFGLFLL